MSLSNPMIVHALQILVMKHEGSRAEEMRHICARRAVSAAYYALFHHLNASAALLIAPNVSHEINHRIRRWFDHLKMKEICGRFIKPKLDQPLLDLIGQTAPPELRTVASNFIVLQEARHSADYDPSYNLTSDGARLLVESAVLAMSSWDKIANTAEANIFILSLLMFKNWERDRI